VDPRAPDRLTLAQFRKALAASQLLYPLRVQVPQHLVRHAYVGTDQLQQQVLDSLDPPLARRFVRGA
jgi:hypothetical protein